MTFWVDISKLFIPVIAFLGAYIAWLQFQANKAKVQLDLYDKRFSIYNALVTVINEALYGEGDLSEKNYKDFQKAVNEAVFLVPEESFKVLIQAKGHLSDLKIKQRALRSIETSNRTDLKEKAEVFIAEILEAENELEDCEAEITEAFKKFMKFENF